MLVALLEILRKCTTPDSSFASAYITCLSTKSARSNGPFWVVCVVLGWLNDKPSQNQTLKSLNCFRSKTTCRAAGRQKRDKYDTLQDPSASALKHCDEVRTLYFQPNILIRTPHVLKTFFLFARSTFERDQVGTQPPLQHLHGKVCRDSGIGQGCGDNTVQKAIMRHLSM